MFSFFVYITFWLFYHIEFSYSRGDFKDNKDNKDLKDPKKILVSLWSFCPLSLLLQVKLGFPNIAID